MEVEKGYTLDEVSQRLRVSNKTIQREIKRGKLSASKVGRRYLISQGSLDQYLGGPAGVEERVEQFCADKKPEMVNLLQRLVSISSESETEGEEKLAKFLKEKLENLGIRVVTYGKGESITVHGSFGYAKKGLLLDCPLDTTPPGDLQKWRFPPFEGVIRDGKMYGRGTADCKAGMVSMIYGVLALKGLVDEDKLRVELVFDGGEQNGSYFGMKETLKKGLDVEGGVIGYAGIFGEIAIGARGYHRFTFNTHGRSAHTGSRGNFGVNAISNMVKFISQMESVKMPKPKDKYFSFGSKMTFSMIEGGRAINIVPDLCTSRLDVRTTPEVKKRYVEETIKSIIRDLKRQHADFEVDYTYDVGQEGYRLESESPVISSLRVSAGKVLENPPSLVVNGPAHIGNLLYQHKVPVVVFGPKGGNVHSYDEYVEISSLPKTAEIYAGTIIDFFGLKT